MPGKSAVSNDAEIEEIQFNALDSDQNCIEFILMGSDGIWKGPRANEEAQIALELAKDGKLIDDASCSKMAGHSLLKYLAFQIYTQKLANMSSPTPVSQAEIASKVTQNLM